eukprot:Nk52_evm36s1401 gene=Nk52_evmTU36s1401
MSGVRLYCIGMLTRDRAGAELRSLQKMFAAKLGSTRVLRRYGNTKPMITLHKPFRCSGEEAKEVAKIVDSVARSTMDVKKATVAGFGTKSNTGIFMKVEEEAKLKELHSKIKDPLVKVIGADLYKTTPYVPHVKMADKLGGGAFSYGWGICELNDIYFTSGLKDITLFRYVDGQFLPEESFPLGSSLAKKEENVN